jgi:hypothetical protein
VRSHQPRSTDDIDRKIASLHDRDFYAWAIAQAAALQERRFSDLDIANLTDEVSGMAEQEVDRLQAKLERLTHQLLLWDFRTASRSPSRATTIRNQRRRAERVMQRCPSLADRREQLLRRAYTYGRFAALREAEDLPMSALPAQSPYSWEDVMTRKLEAPDCPRQAE